MKMQTNTIRLSVVGLPAPQGSKTRMPNGAMVDGGSSATGRANLAAWRASVKQAAQDWLAEHPQPPLAEAVSVSIRFYFPLPASDPWRTRHTTAPDADKCARSVLDALVHAGLLADDRYVCDLNVAKWYARVHPAGADIEIHSEAANEDRLRGVLKAQAKARRKRPQPATETEGAA